MGSATPDPPLHLIQPGPKRARRSFSSRRLNSMTRPNRRWGAYEDKLKRDFSLENQKLGEAGFAARGRSGSGDPGGRVRVAGNRQIVER